MANEISYKKFNVLNFNERLAEIELSDEEKEMLEQENSVDNIAANILRMEDSISLRVLEDEIRNTLIQDNEGFVINTHKNFVRMLSDNIENLKIAEFVNYESLQETKEYLNNIKLDIAIMVLEHLKDKYGIEYFKENMNGIINLEVVASLYEFFILRKKENIGTYMFNLLISKNKHDFQEGYDEAINEIVRELEESKISKIPLTDDKLEFIIINFFKFVELLNKSNESISSMGQFIYDVCLKDEEELTNKDVLQAYYNFGSDNGFDFNDKEAFSKYFKLLEKPEQANEILREMFTHYLQR